MIETAPPSGSEARAFWALALPLSLAKLALHLSLAGRYGYHRDELYFIACGKHPAFGYVDHPPLVPLFARVVGGAFDYSLFGLRLPSALASAATLLLTMLLARHFGGGRRAQVLAGTCVAVAPALLRMAKILCLPVFEPVFWLAAILLTSRVLRGGHPRGWLAVGLACGLGLLNKHTMALFGLGLAVGLLATPSARHHLRRPWLWAGVGVAAAVFAPNVIWQVQHDFATLEFLDNMRHGTLARESRVLFLAGQVLYMHPLTLPVWAAGLWWLARAPDAARDRPLLWLYPTALGVLLAMGAKPYYLTPVYPLLLAAGAVQLEHVLARRPRVVYAAVAVLLAGGVFLGSSSVPLLPLPQVDARVERLVGWAVPALAITHDLHDEYGWAEQAATVERVLDELPPEEREAAAVFTVNYGEASALRFFGRQRALRAAVSGHMSYYLWGPPREHGKLVVYGLGEAELDLLCARREERARTHHPLAVPAENGLPIYLCTPRTSLAGAWPQLKRYWHGPRPSS